VTPKKFTIAPWSTIFSTVSNLLRSATKKNVHKPAKKKLATPGPKRNVIRAKNLSKNTAVIAGVANAAIWTKNVRRINVWEEHVTNGVKMDMDAHSLRKVSNVAVVDASARPTTIPSPQKI
jgi:hypothetical protein